MTPRVPTLVDFPSNITLTIIPPPSTPASSSTPLNILILLHGLGDTRTPFASFSKALNLPSTTCISLQAPSPIPEIFTGNSAPSFHWGDDILFDERKGEIDADAGFTKALKILSEVVETLKEKCEYNDRNIHFLGFGQGGMTALFYAFSHPINEFGGVISIGGKLPQTSTSSSSSKAKTPILICGGSRSQEITRSAVDRCKEVFGEVEYVKWEKQGDAMPRNREEMLPIMRFFGRRLQRRMGVPEGMVEL